MFGIDRQVGRPHVRQQPIWRGRRSRRERFTVSKNDERYVAAEQPHGRLDNSVEYRLHVSRRPADDPQNIGRGPLLVSCCATSVFCAAAAWVRRRVAVGAIRLWPLAVLRPFAGRALRAFALVLLPPVFDSRAISAPY